MRLSYKLLATIIAIWISELQEIVDDFGDGHTTPNEHCESLQRIIKTIKETEVDLRRYGQGEEF